jgi:hypothetical protein
LLFAVALRCARVCGVYAVCALLLTCTESSLVCVYAHAHLPALAADSCTTTATGTTNTTTTTNNHDRQPSPHLLTFLCVRSGCTRRSTSSGKTCDCSPCQQSCRATTALMPFRLSRLSTTREWRQEFSRCLLRHSCSPFDTIALPGLILTMSSADVQARDAAENINTAACLGNAA